MKTKEKSVEQYLRAEVEARGGVCIKLDPANNKGFPDRLVLLPYSVALLIEVKRPKGGVVSGHQEVWHERLARMGHVVSVRSSVEDVDKAMGWYDRFRRAHGEVADNA